jgi:long-chain fatty acid transport protein
MKKGKILSVIALSSLPLVTFATNGDLLIGVGAVSRSMGGIGIAVPTGADGVIFSNPALMTYYDKTIFSFGGTLFMPHTKAYEKCTTPNGVVEDSRTSDAKYYAIPSIGIIYPLNKKLFFGISAYGISGMGVDYRNTNIDCGSGEGCYTNFQFMEVAPSIAYKFNSQLSIGLGLDLTYGGLDLGNGLSSDYGIGAQLGLAWKVNEIVNLGLAIKSPVKMTYSRVMDFNNDGTLDDMDLEQPLQIGAGIGLKPLEKLQIGMDIQWVNWSDAKGYKDFDWNDQWIFKIGGQYNITKKLVIRAGYNYGKSPIDGHTLTITNQQALGIMECSECMRIIGFPAIVEHHISVGAGYQITDKLHIDVSYMHAFENSVESTSTTTGDYWKSKLSEDSISLGLTWEF